jgi:hypothetical protein
VTSSSTHLETRPKNTTPIAPREHGFWVILGVVVLSALSRTGSSGAALAVALAVVIGAVALGSITGRRIRRSAVLQLVATGALSLAGIPIELAGGATSANAALDACAWLAVFTAAALGVRACFARSSRGRRDRATLLGLGSIVVPLVVAGLFALASLQAHALATLAVALGIAGTALFRPTAKHLKPVGIAFLTISVVAAVVLRIS